MASSSTDTRLSKKQKIEMHCKLLKAGCTKTALSQILATLQAQGLLDTSMEADSERAVRESLQQALKVHSGATTPYGKVVQKMNLGECCPEWSFVHPRAHLYHLAKLSPSFGALISSIIGESCKVLNVVIYIDEMCPGNPLRPDKARTLQCVYYTFLEYPAHILTMAEGWHLFGVLRSTIADKVPGGVSGFLKLILRQMFLCKESNLQIGAQIACKDDIVVLRARFSCFLADEKAHEELMNVKGASGMKPCPTCKNIVNRVDVGAHAYLQNLSCCEYDKFDYHTNESFWEVIDHLRNQKHVLSKTKFAELQKYVGVNYDEDTLLYDDSLRSMVKPIDMIVRDWMHTLVSGGVASTEISLVLQLLVEAGISLGHVTEYSLRFKLPMAKSQPDADWFSEKRIGEEHMRTPAASDHISMVCLLNAFLQNVVAPANILNENCECFDLLNNIVEILALGPEESVKHLADLKSLIVQHNKLFSVLYPDHLKPKFHHMFHIVDNVTCLNKLLSCFVTERKHRTMKAAALHSMRHVEHTVTIDIVNRFFEMARECENMFAASFLLEPRKHNIMHNVVQTSLKAKLKCGNVRAKDFVCVKNLSRVGRVIRFMSVDENIYVQVSTRAMLNQASCLYSNVADDVSFIDASLIVCPLTWAVYDNNSIRVLWPFHLAISEPI